MEMRKRISWRAAMPHSKVAFILRTTVSAEFQTRGCPNLILHTTGLVKTEKLKLSLKEKSIGCLSWLCKQVILVNVAFSLIKRNESSLYLSGI